MIAAKKTRWKGLNLAIILGAPLWGHGLGGPAGLKLGLLVSGFVLVKLTLPYAVAYLRDHGGEPESKTLLWGAAGVVALCLVLVSALY